LKNIEALIQFIKKNKDWQDKLSKNPYNIRIKEHPTKAGLFLFSYNMIESDFSKQEVKASRGTQLRILDDGTVEVVSHSFDKFHNYGESNAAKINWKGKIWAREKADGSLIKRYYDPYDNNMVFSTNNSFGVDADLPGKDLIGCPYKTFGDLISVLLPSYHEEIFDTVNIRKNHLEFPAQDWTIYFELCSKWNRVVVLYEKPELVLLGARNNITHDEITPEEAKKKFKIKNIRTPICYELSSKTPEEIVEFVKTFDANREGIVIQDEDFNRVKIKGEAYLSIHRMKDNSGQMSFNHCFAAIQTGVIDDILANFPEYSDQINEIIDKWKALLKFINANLHYYGSIISDPIMQRFDEKRRKKEYAQLVFQSEKSKAISSVLFELYKTGSTKGLAENYLKSIDYDKFLSLYEAING
jgi:RNA ligase